MVRKQTREITELVLAAQKQAALDASGSDNCAFAAVTKPVKWPIQCMVGPGLEGAIACESKIGYVNGAKGKLIYRGFDIFDLCAHSTFEEVSYLLLHGKLPGEVKYESFKKKLRKYLNINQTIRLLMNFPIEQMNAMGALRLGTNLMRQEGTYVDIEGYKPEVYADISVDEDSIPMETKPAGEAHAIYEFKRENVEQRLKTVAKNLHSPTGFESSYHLISGVASMAAAVCRMRQGYLPIEPDGELSHAGNLLFMMTGRKPDPINERIMDIALILHADHGMNASTFAALVVASTLSDLYFAVGSGIAALTGPLHGGANERVLHMLREIGSHKNVKSWFDRMRAKKGKIMGFGHRVYKSYDPRARVLKPLAQYLVHTHEDKEVKNLFKTAQELEKRVVETLGKEKGIFPNVDFYSGIVYMCLGIPVELFTPIFAVSRVAGWTSRVMEYLEQNRIFRPRALYTGTFDKKYVPMQERMRQRK